MDDCRNYYSINKGGKEKLMTGQIQFITAMVMIGLFSIALIGFGIGFAVDNNSPVSIVDDPEISVLFTETKGNISNFATDSQSQYSSIIETTIAPGSQTPQSVGSFAITPVNALGVVKNIVGVGYIKIFGTGSGFGIFFTSFISLLVFILGLYLYKTLRGLPD